MRLSNEMLVRAPAARAWALLTDPERVAPVGTLPVRVGAIAVTCQWDARVEDMDASRYRVVISARGADTSGQGQAHALITAQLVSEGELTRVLVDSDITISGPLAQAGRGALADASARLMAEFADRLDADLAGAPAFPGAATQAAATQAAAVTALAVPGARGGPGRVRLAVLARQALPVMAGAVIGALVARRLARHS